jgi:hypothetical protein
VLLAQRQHLRQRREIAVHAEDGVGGDQAHARSGGREALLERAESPWG